MKFCSAPLKKQDGFTLIELIIVLAVLGMLAALAIPQFTRVLENSAVKTDEANAAVVQTALEVYKADNGGIAPVLKEADGDDFDRLVTALKDTGYLKTGEIKEQSGGIFTYTEGDVKFIPKADPGNS